MSRDKYANTTRIVRSFLESNADRLRRALEIEEAVESIRSDAAKALHDELTRRIAALEQVAYPDKDKRWTVTTLGKWAASAEFRLLLTRSRGNWTANIWILHWSAHRLHLEVWAQGWPAEAKDVRLGILEVFQKFVQRRENSEVWSEHEGNKRTADRISYHFRGEGVLLFGDINENARQRAEGIEKLIIELSRVMDSA